MNVYLEGGGHNHECAKTKPFFLTFIVNRFSWAHSGSGAGECGKSILQFDKWYLRMTVLAKKYY